MTSRCISAGGSHIVKVISEVGNTIYAIYYVYTEAILLPIELKFRCTACVYTLNRPKKYITEQNYNNIHNTFVSTKNFARIDTMTLESRQPMRQHINNLHDTKELITKDHS